MGDGGGGSGGSVCGGRAVIGGGSPGGGTGVRVVGRIGGGGDFIPAVPHCCCDGCAMFAAVHARLVSDATECRREEQQRAFGEKETKRGR